MTIFRKDALVLVLTFPTVSSALRASRRLKSDKKGTRKPRTSPTARHSPTIVPSNAPTMCQTFEDVICAPTPSEFETLCQLAKWLTDNSFIDFLGIDKSGNGWTLFAPTEAAAFEKFPQTKAEKPLQNTMELMTHVTEYLLSHVVPATLDDLPCGEDVFFMNNSKGKIVCDTPTEKYIERIGVRAQLPQHDPIVTCNGVIHVMDQELLPAPTASPIASPIDVPTDFPTDEPTDMPTGRCDDDVEVDKCSNHIKSKNDCGDDALIYCPATCGRYGVGLCAKGSA